MNNVLYTLLETTLYSSAMIFGVFAIKTIFQNKISKRLVSVLWLIVLLRLAMPVTIDSPVHLDKLFMADRPAASGITDIGPQEETEPVAEPSANNPSEMQPSSGTALVNAGPGQTLDNAPGIFERAKDFLNRINLYALAFSIWLGGMLTVLLVNCFNMAAFGIRIRKCGVSADVHVRQALDSAKMALRFKKDVEIVESIHVPVPMVYGILRKKIILPVNLKNSIDLKKLILILIHELCHIRRMDTAVNILWLLAKAVHWFNPLVWIAYRIYLTDMELACDEIVADHISDSGRLSYSQGLIDIVRLSNSPRPAMIRLSFCNNTKELKKRIRNMIAPVKKKKTASLAAVMLSVLMVVGCFTTACGPTPHTVADGQENSVVLTVDEGLRERTEAALADNIDEGIPSSFTSSLEGEGVKIIIDAQVNAPEQNLQSLILAPRELTQEFADSFMNYFTGDAPLYEDKGGGRFYESLQSEIIMWQDCIANAQNNWDEVKDHDPYQEGTQEETIASFQTTIETLQWQLDKTPVETEYVQINKKFHYPIEQGKDYPDGPEIYTDYSRMVISGYVEVENSNITDHMACYYICKNEDTEDSLSYNNINHLALMLSRTEYDEIAKTITMPLEDALAYAQEAIDGVGAENMVLSEYNISAAKNRDGELYPYYRFYYTKDINASQISVSRSSICKFKSDHKHSGIETINVSVDESGVIGFDWMDPTEIKSVNDVDILTFNELMELAQTQLLTQPYEIYNDLEIVISDISFSWIIIKTDDSNDSITVPVWNFIGYHYDPNDPESKQKATDDPNSYTYLTINAIDGSIIGW